MVPDRIVPLAVKIVGMQVYVCQLLIGFLIVTGLAVWLVRREVRSLTVIVGLAVTYLAAQVLLTDRGSTVNRVVWGFRPLQPLLLAVAVAGLVPATKALRWFAVALGGGVIGIG